MRDPDRMIVAKLSAKAGVKIGKNGRGMRQFFLACRSARRSFRVDVHKDDTSSHDIPIRGGRAAPGIVPLTRFTARGDGILDPVGDAIHSGGRELLRHGEKSKRALQRRSMSKPDLFSVSRPYA